MRSLLRFVPFALACLAATAPGATIPYKFPPTLETDKRIAATADGTAIPLIATPLGSILSFGMDAPAEVTLELKNAPRTVVVRPQNAGIKAELSGTRCRFTLPRPMNLSVEFDNDTAHPVFIFANAPEQRPDRRDPKVRYFEAGKVHDAGEIRLGDGETAYLEGGAVVHGTVRATGKDISLRGPGIFDCRPQKKKSNMLFFRKCDGVTLSDVTLIGTFGWSIHLSGSENLTLGNVRVVSWRANSDGLDIEYCRKVAVQNCFWRTFDDCIAVKALFPPDFDGLPAEMMTDPEQLNAFTGAKIPGDTIGDITIERCTLWNDVPGNAFEIGFELRVDNLRHVVFRDNDIIHVMRGAAFSIHNCDRANIADILVENIRVEDTDELFDLCVGLSVYSEDCPAPYRRNNPARIPTPARLRDAITHDNEAQWIIPEAADHAKYAANRGSIAGVTFRDIRTLARPRSPSLLLGYDERHGIADVTFERVRIAGEPVDSAEKLNLKTRHARDIRFIREPDTAGAK